MSINFEITKRHKCTYLALVCASKVHILTIAYVSDSVCQGRSPFTKVP